MCALNLGCFNHFQCKICLMFILVLTSVYSAYLLFNTNNNVKLRWIDKYRKHISHWILPWKLKPQSLFHTCDVSVTHKRVAHSTSHAWALVIFFWLLIIQWPMVMNMQWQLPCSYLSNCYNYSRTLCIKCWVSAFHTQI
jgi:hypothetical protein